jgi:hypothetical protein
MTARAITCVLFAAAGAACATAAPPVVAVEEHHEAVTVWAAAGVPDALLLHFDAHEDLGEPDEDGELSPADVIVPALRSGAIRDYVWVKPPWLAAPRGTVLAELGAPEGEFILGFDLDFFACENPHADHLDVEITRAEYDARLAAGRVRMRGEAREGDVVTESTVLARPPGPFTWPVRLDRARDLATGKSRYVRGLICMGEYRDAFPVHRPDEAELDALFAAVREALARLPRPPLLVTIARSATSGFVPAARVAVIEARLRDILIDLWP